MSLTKSFGILKEVGQTKATKNKGMKAGRLEEIEGAEPNSRENQTTSSDKTYILPAKIFLLKAFLDFPRSLNKLATTNQHGIRIILVSSYHNCHVRFQTSKL